MGYDQLIYRERKGTERTEVGYHCSNYVLHALLFGHSLHDDGYFFTHKLGIRTIKKALDNARHLSSITNKGETLTWEEFTAICPITDYYERKKLTLYGYPDELAVTEWYPNRKEFVDVFPTIRILDDIWKSHKPGDTYEYSII